MKRGCHLWLLSFFLLVAESQAVDRLRMATYNVCITNRAMDQVAQNIAEAQADIVTLQETAPALETFLQQHFRKKYPFFHFQGHQGKYSPERLGFLSRYRLSKVQFLPPQDGLFGVLVAQFAVPGGTVQIANVHLNPVRGRNLSNEMAVFEAWSASDEIRWREVKRILTKLEGNMPRVVAGDFNSFSWGSAPTFLRAQGFVDSYASVHAEADQGITWKSQSGLLPVGVRLDYIYHDPSWKTIASRVLTNNSSDHFLLVTEMARRE